MAESSVKLQMSTGWGCSGIGAHIPSLQLQCKAENLAWESEEGQESSGSSASDSSVTQGLMSLSGPNFFIFKMGTPASQVIVTLR